MRRVASAFYACRLLQSEHAEGKDQIEMGILDAVSDAVESGQMGFRVEGMERYGSAIFELFVPTTLECAAHGFVDRSLAAELEQSDAWNATLFAAVPPIREQQDARYDELHAQADASGEPVHDCILHKLDAINQRLESSNRMMA